MRQLRNVPSLVKTAASVASTMILAIAVDATLSSLNLMGLNASEVGYRAGSLSDYHVSYRLLGGLPLVQSFPTGEGYLLLGNDSSRNATLNGHVVSPSYFSTSAATYGATAVSGPVVAHFRKLRYWWFLSGETDVKVDSFSPQAPGEKLSNDCAVKHGWWNKRTGVMTGKIVETASVGNPYLWKTHEVIIHTGGNEFTQMSVTTQSVFDCAVAVLKGGETVKITYDDKLIRDPVTQATSYDLVGIAR